MITGAASGIGEAVATLLAAGGSPLLLVDRDAERLHGLRERLREVEVHAVPADVTDEGALLEAVRATRDHRSELSGLVTCAGIEVLGAVDVVPAAEWTRCLTVNLTGTYLALRAALPELAASRGSVAMIASDGGVFGAADYTAYCASKHGVVGLMRAAALELAPRGIRVNAVAPGFVETPMANRIFADDAAGMTAYARSLPMGRFATAREVAKVVRHLLSDDASYTNGAVYMVDGAANTGSFEPQPEREAASAANVALSS